MAASRIIQYIHRPTLTELGWGNTHDRYLVVDSDKDLSNVFPLGIEVNLLDTISNKTYNVYSKVETNEFRLKRLGDIVDDYHMEPGDEIVITHYELSDKVINLLTVNECGRVLLNPGKRRNGKIEDFEIVKIEKLPNFSGTGNYSYACEYNGTIKDISISFSESRKKRTDSPSETKYYSVKFGQENLSYDSKKYYYLTIRDGIIVLRSLPKSDYRVLLDNKDSNNRIYEVRKDLQVIYYGAPGTGKSNEIKKQTIGKCVIRTTFHPDSDYSTFVGSYKPTMDEVNIQVVPVVVKSGISLQDSGTYKEKRITYKFVMQAFLKAYLKAWKQYADGSHLRSDDIEDLQSQKKQNNNDITVKIDGSILVLNTSMADAGRQILSKYIELAKSEKSLDEIIEEWNTSIAVNGFFKLTRVESVTSNWEKYLVINDACYLYTGIKGKDWPLFCENVKDLFDLFGHQIEILKDNHLSQSTNDTFPKDDIPTLFADSPMALNDDKAESVTRSPVFLIIEEINRGNCAQIFGDLFQLLDRSDNGFSEYPIEADTDLQQEIEKAFNELGEYRLDSGFNVEGVVENYTSNYGATLSEDIKHGRILLLPSNLYIWATMNTSDQSLFPIDSAFKRRWNWVYMPIDTKKENWSIRIGNDYYSWTAFLNKVNDELLTDETAEDKHLGFYFCKASEKKNESDQKPTIITQEAFVAKVLFYLWSDVFKVYGIPAAIGSSKDWAFAKFYNINGTINEAKVKDLMSKLNISAFTDDTIDIEVMENSAEAKNSTKNTLKSVAFPDGVVFDTSVSVFDAYVKAVEKIGVEKIIPVIDRIKFQRSNRPLISTVKYPELDNKDGFSYYQIGNCYFVKGTHTYTYVRILEVLNELLNVGMTIEN